MNIQSERWTIKSGHHSPEYAHLKVHIDLGVGSDHVVSLTPIEVSDLVAALELATNDQNRYNARWADQEARARRA
jgi:hypothetical protein